MRKLLVLASIVGAAIILTATLGSLGAIQAQVEDKPSIHEYIDVYTGATTNNTINGVATLITNYTSHLWQNQDMPQYNVADLYFVANANVWAAQYYTIGLFLQHSIDNVNWVTTTLNANVNSSGTVGRMEYMTTTPIVGKYYRIQVKAFTGTTATTRTFYYTPTYLGVLLNYRPYKP
jgi:hypothetical protein